MINVVCLKWGSLYGPEYVNRLYYAICRNLTLPFKFHCFTDNSHSLHEDIIVHPLPYSNLEGWWHKLYLFSEEIDIEGRILFIDLDTLITGNIDAFVNLEGFIGLNELRPPGFAYLNKIGSGFMSWTAGEHCEVWDSFIANPTAAINSVKPHGDQRWIDKMVQTRQYWQDLFPGAIVSFKWECANGLPPGAKVVCYHGLPKIPESITETNIATACPKPIPPQPWVADHWKDEV